MVDVGPISIVHVPSLLHQNHIGVTYEGISNFRMEPVRSMPLYFVAMPQSIITITEVSFVSAPIHTVDGFRSRPQIPKGTKFVNLHEDKLEEVNKVFAS
jgi:hypothetical protein